MTLTASRPVGTPSVWAAVAFALTLIVPSTTVVHRFFGVAGVAVYAGLALVALIYIHRRAFNRIVAALTGPRAAVLGVGLFVALVAAFSVGYPLANSGRMGPGSDRDEHIEIATTELLQARYPYYRTGPAGNPITQMPGALLLAVPFVLLGNGAYQNLFWLAVFTATVAWLRRDVRPALALTVVLLTASPVVLREYVAGGDLLANSIYVLVFAVWLVEVVSRPGRPWIKVVSAIAFGIGLSSRVHFLLVVPPVFAALRHRAGTGEAVRAMVMTGATVAVLTLPFYYYDPAAFWPFRLLEYDASVPHGRLVNAVFLAVPTIVSLVCALDGAVRETPILLRYCTVVLVAVVLTDIGIPAITGPGPALSDVPYGLSFVPFGALAFMPQAPPRP